MQKHQFEAFGALKTCLKCFHLETDDIHTVSESNEETELRIQKEHAISNRDIALANAERAKKLAFVVPGSVLSHNSTEPEPELPPEVPEILPDEIVDVLKFDVFQPDNDHKDPGALPQENEIALPVVARICKGHECPDCHRDWFHDYECGKAGQGLCQACATQAAVVINRPVELEQLAQLASQNLSGQDRAEIITTHTSVVYNMIRDNKGEIRPDWQEVVHVHIRDLEQIIEKCRIKVLNTRKMMTDELAKEMVKLTPEERAQYMRDAAKQNRAKEPKEPKEAKPVDEKALYQKMMKDLMSGIKIRATKAGKSFSDDEIQKIAEKQYKLQQDMEGSL
jgi:hypothetical protein